MHYAAISILDNIDIRDTTNIYIPLKLSNNQFIQPCEPSASATTNGTYFRKGGDGQPRKSNYASLNVSKSDLCKLLYVGNM